MLKQLSSLIALHLTGEWLILGIFDEAFLQEDVFETVRILKLELHDGEDYDNPAAATLSRDLAQHLSLSRLSFTGNCVELPLDLLNLSPSVALPPRSWSLEDFSLNLLVLIGPESRNLFSAFANLSSLYVTTLMVHDDFMRDLAFLPPTLTSLTLLFGVTCPGDPDLVVPHPAFGEYGDLAPHFPNLIDLTLGGDIVKLATFDFIRTSLPSLLLLTFKAHTRLSYEPLLAILENSSGEGPNICLLEIDICSCQPGKPLAGRARRQPQWPPDFGIEDAEDLIDFADDEGIEMLGTILCATRQCEGVEHECARFYK